MSDFRRQRNEARIGRDYSPSVGDIKHIERMAANPSPPHPSYDPSDLFAKPAYKTKLARREQEQRETCQAEPADFVEQEYARIKKEKRGNREDSASKSRRKSNRSNQSSRYLRIRKNETLTIDEAPKIKKSLQQRS